ncbi:MAG: hypothetical protein RMJ51_00255 [Candidatus Calescibacterium sp.]|nr:hypothetical protein [Candidatus Calescibacterium sp.]MCX7972049.1 hypothetical protein [bacterium]MDW8194667.1 hypothetical protein [Candidatus Calescibacterium sp.]
MDKNTYPQKITDLFTDTYTDYLPRQIASVFIYSPWGSEIKLYNLNSTNKSTLFLYLEYKSVKKKYIPSIILQKLKEEIYFHNFYSVNNKEYMIFVISFAYR